MKITPSATKIGRRIYIKDYKKFGENGSSYYFKQGGTTILQTMLMITRRLHYTNN
jgi:hypothetical protein